MVIQKHYKTIHNRKKRSKKGKKVTEELLLSRAQEMFERMSKEKFVRDMARRFDNISIRVDLVGTPEVSFVLAVQKGKLKFLTEHMYTDMAVGIHKEYFLELLENPLEFGNMKVIHNNVIFRKGIVKMFKYARPLLSSGLLSGELDAAMQRNKLPKGRLNKY